MDIPITRKFAAFVTALCGESTGRTTNNYLLNRDLATPESSSISIKFHKHMVNFGYIV
jgi:hypothetical protein